MSSRLSSAILALAAAFLLAISLATSAWWAGHPVSPTRTYTQIAHVGLHGAKLCLVDNADLETCKDAPTQSVFGPVGYIELVACLLLVISSTALGVMTLKRREDRKTFGLLVLGGGPLAIVLAFALIAIGPTSEASIPYGYGLYMFFVGAIGAIIAGVLSRRAQPEIAIAPPSFAAPMPMTPSQQQMGVDMAALMRDDTMRPSQPEPMLGGRVAPPPNAGGNLPGPAGPLGAPATSSQPPALFQSAPQLRPLYEVQGSAPVAPPPKFPQRAPTPQPRDKIAAQMGRTPLPAKSATKPPPFSRTLPAEKPKEIDTPPPLAPPISRTFPAAVVPPVRATPIPKRPTPTAEMTPEPEPLANATDPEGLPTVGDSTEVNLPISPSTGENPTTTEEVALQANDDAETIEKERVSITEIEKLELPKKKVAISTAPDSLPPPIENKRATSVGPSPACPQCESPMAWVEEHLRFYCKSCRMYF